MVVMFVIVTLVLVIVMVVMFVVVTLVLVIVMVVMFVIVTLILVMVVVMMVVMPVAVVIVVMMALAVGIVALVLVRFLQPLKLGCQSVLLLRRLQNLCARQFVPIGGYDCRALIVCADYFNTLGELFLGKSRCMAEHYRARIFYLVVEKFAEVFRVHFAFFRVDYGSETVELCPCGSRSLYRFDDIRKLAYSRRLDYYSVGRKFVYNL